DRRKIENRYRRALDEPPAEEKRRERNEPRQEKARSRRRLSRDDVPRAGQKDRREADTPLPAPGEALDLSELSGADARGDRFLFHEEVDALGAALFGSELVLAAPAERLAAPDARLRARGRSEQAGPDEHENRGRGADDRRRKDRQGSAQGLRRGPDVELGL